MIIEDVELYLSKDIIQSESVPFFITWKSDDLESIKLESVGFTKILEYDNIKKGLTIEDGFVKIEYLISNNYFGGLLKTEASDNPYKKASLTAMVTRKSGKTFNVIEERLLFSTSLNFTQLPSLITMPVDKPPIILQLKGRTTIFIDIETDEGSELNLDFTDDVKKVLLNFLNALKESLNEVLNKYPKYEIIIKKFIQKVETKQITSEKQLVDEASLDMDTIKNDQSFLSDFATAFLYAMQSESAFGNVILRPFIEYIEEYATTKCFLNIPFLCIRLKKGKSRLKLKIKTSNLLDKGKVQNNNSQKFLYIDTEIESPDSFLIPIKDLIKFERVHNDDS